MSYLTVIKTESAKVCLFDYRTRKVNQPFEELYLSKSNDNLKDCEENDHLIIQKISSKDDGIIYHINGKEVESRVIEEIIRFLKD